MRRSLKRGIRGRSTSSTTFLQVTAVADPAAGILGKALCQISTQHARRAEVTASRRHLSGERGTR